MKRRKLTNRMSTLLLIAGSGVASGLIAVLLWPKIKAIVVNAKVSLLPETIKRIPAIGQLR